MAELNFDGRIKVKNLKENFKNRIYNCRITL